MSNSVVNTAKSVGSFFVRWSIRLTKMAKHRFLTKRKNLLIFSEKDHPLYLDLFKKLHKHWEITLIKTTPEVQTNTEDLNENIETTTDESEKKTEVEVSSEPPKESKPTFFRQFLMDNNYNSIEQSLEGKQFDSVVVLPSLTEAKHFQFQDQKFAIDFIEDHHTETMRNIFGYRLASKYLATTGVLILSAGQKDFLKGQSPEYINSVTQSDVQESPSIELIDMQSIYLTTIMGERDYTDLNSWPLVALSRDWITRNPDLVLKQYVKWCHNQQLPMPGSFALFKQKTSPYKSDYLQYI